MPVSESSLGSGLESGLESGVAAFFRSYERVSASGDVAALAAQFAEVFLAGGPQGAKCVRAADFALALPKRKELFDSMGRTESKLVGLEETALDARYRLARTRWSMRIANEGKEARGAARVHISGGHGRSGAADSDVSRAPGCGGGGEEGDGRADLNWVGGPVACRLRVVCLMAHAAS